MITSRKSATFLAALPLLTFAALAADWAPLDPEPSDPRKQSSFEYQHSVIKGQDQIWAERCYDEIGDPLTGKHRVRVTYRDSSGTVYTEDGTYAFKGGDQVDGEPFVPKNGPIAEVLLAEVDQD